MVVVVFFWHTVIYKNGQKQKVTERQAAISPSPSWLALFLSISIDVISPERPIFNRNYFYFFSYLTRFIFGYWTVASNYYRHNIVYDRKNSTCSNCNSFLRRDKVRLLFITPKIWRVTDKETEKSRGRKMEGGNKAGRQIMRDGVWRERTRSNTEEKISRWEQQEGTERGKVTKWDETWSRYMR